MHRSLAVTVVLAGACLAQPAAPGPDGFVTLLDVELADEPWSGVLVPQVGPPRDGQPTEALRWPVAQRPGPDSPVLLNGWQDAEAVRFWLHLDVAQPYKLNVLLTGGGNGYFMTAIPLDFTGWRQITLPIAQFARVREVELSDSRRLSFRAQGYGQPALDPNLVWWVDRLEVKPKPGATLAVTNSLEANRSAWEALAAQGNPYAALLAARYAKPVAPFKPPEEITSAWQYRTMAEQLAPLAWAAADPASPHRGRKDLVDHAVALGDWLVEHLSNEGWWWQKNPPTGDPNVNRFALGPLLDAVRWLRALPEGQAAWGRWRDRLDRAVDLQRRAYQGLIPWDWGGLAAGEYANQDAYYVLILALSAELFDRPADLELARAMLRRVADNLLPDGGISYIGVENEAPVYHALNLIILGRYAKLTGDPAALELLRQTANYWPLVLTAEGQPEFWSDVWWKQSWGYVWPESLVVAAGATGDARNQGLMWRALERTGPNDGGLGGLYAMDWWPGTAPGEPLPERFLVRDRNMRGLRGRDGQWYFGVAQGRGLRNTFVGGLVTHPRHTRPLLAAFRGAQIDVIQDANRPNGLWLSQVTDDSALALRPEHSAALGVHYTLQPGLINGWPTPTTPPSPWRVTQVWRAAADGLLGLVALEATEPAPGVAVVGRLAFGPRPVEAQPDGSWRAGPLQVRLLQSFGVVAPAPVPTYATPREQYPPGLELRATLTPPSRPGTRFVYAAWVAPEGQPAPTAFHPLPNDAGWVATWPDGRQAAVVYNPSEQPASVHVPWTAGAAAAWSGEDGQAAAASRQGGAVTVTVAPGACVLVESGG